jgi:hypothetical protein
VPNVSAAFPASRPTKHARNATEGVPYSGGEQRALEAAEVLFDLLGAAVGEESAGLGGSGAGLDAGGGGFFPTGKAGAFEGFPVERSGAAGEGKAIEQKAAKAAKA